MIPLTNLSSSSRYTRHQIISEGTYGKVYECTDNKTGRKMALKKCKRELLAEGVPASTLKEISLLRKVHHPNIVKLHDVLIVGEELSLVLEYMPYNLKEYLERFGKTLGDIEKRILLYQIISGVAYLHSKTILHRDLKPCNILISKNGIPKIADFGLGRRYTIPVGTYTHEVATLYYRAPELLLGTSEYSTPVDVWALGCIFAEVFSGCVLFRGDSEIGQLFAVFRALGTPSEEVWGGVTRLRDYKCTFPQWKKTDLAKMCPSIDSDGIDLLEKMLRYDPVRRITPSKALKHPFFRAIIPN
eukprot:TRINITY_DN503_c0_g1_i8.p1 TRINITY_DN503_c0_g1~~TRINITY_DN503_c0_g1_i8.p1  ORF type:complete len:301 (-),score=77.38 TRINITY_DN503_c0_g1_i8:231-1133(-)